MEALHDTEIARLSEVQRISPSLPQARIRGTRSKVKVLFGAGAVALVAIPAVTAWNAHVEHTGVKERAEQTVERLRDNASSQVSMIDLTQAMEPFARSFHHNKWQRADSLLIQQVMIHTLMREIERDIHAKLGADIPLSEAPQELLSHWVEIIGGEKRMSPAQRALRENLVRAMAAMQDTQRVPSLQRHISPDASQFVREAWRTEDALANHLPPLPQSHDDQTGEESLARMDVP